MRTAGSKISISTVRSVTDLAGARDDGAAPRKLPNRHGWDSVDHYLRRVTKARILEAVREGVSTEAAERLSGLRKPDMAREAKSLLSESPRLPACLRTVVRKTSEAEDVVFAHAGE